MQTTSPVLKIRLTSSSLSPSRNLFNTIFQTDATLEMNRLLHVHEFMAKFVTMTVLSDVRAQQLDYSILAVSMDLRNMLANCEEDLDENIVARIFDSVRKFYSAVVNKMVKSFPFHNDMLTGPAVLKPDPALLESWSLSSVHELATEFDFMIHD